MKKLISLFTIIAILFAACSKDSSTPNDNNGNSSNSTVITGDFVITKFTDDNPNEDKTAHFSGYTFTFNDNGTVAAIKNSITENGSYTEKPSHEGEAAKLTLSFGSAALDELNKSWQIDLISNSAIHLSDDGNASEVLQFTAK